jgi:glycosyltransferase involved in cell wall biosynthesis
LEVFDGEVEAMGEVAVMIKVWNEEFFLDLILPYYDWLGVDYVYIWDDGSTDNTVQMIKDFISAYEGRTIYHLFTDKEPHDEYFRNENEGELKNEHIKYIEDRTNVEWIIDLDADEVLAKSWKGLVNYLKQGIEKVVDYYAIPTINLYDGIGKMLHRGKQDGKTYYYYPDMHIRIYNIRRERKMRYGTNQNLDQQLMPVPYDSEAVKRGRNLSFYASLIHLHTLFPWRRSKRFAVGENMQERRFKTTEYVDVIEVGDMSIFPEVFISWFHKKVREMGTKPFNFREKVR